MGMDLEAHLYYGLPVTDPDDSEGDDFDLDEAIRKMNGLQDRYNTVIYGSEDYDEYRKEFEEVQKPWAALDVVLRGYEEFINHCIIIKSTEVNVEWSTLGDVPDLTVDPAWRELLKSFCEKAEIPFTEPAWHFSGLYW